MDIQALRLVGSLRVACVPETTDRDRDVAQQALEDIGTRRAHALPNGSASGSPVNLDLVIVPRQLVGDIAAIILTRLQCYHHLVHVWQM